MKREFKQTVVGHSAGYRSVSITHILKNTHTHKHQLSLGMRINLAEHPHLQSRLVDAFCIPNTPPPPHAHMHTRRHTHTHTYKWASLFYRAVLQNCFYESIPVCFCQTPMASSCLSPQHFFPFTALWCAFRL